MTQVTLSCFSQTQMKGDRDERLIQAKRMQSSIFSRFTAKRGAGRIERYFVKLRGQQINLAINLTAFAITVILVVLHIYLQDINFRSYLTSTIDDMMASTRAQTFYFSVNLFFEAHYFSTLFADLFSSPSLFLPTLENSFNITQLQVRALKSVVLRGCFVMDMGLPSGSIIAVETNNYDLNKIILWFSNVSINREGYLCSWTSDKNGINTSYPKNGGMCLDPYFSALSRTWYQYAVSLNKPTWTNIYYSILDNEVKIPVISAVAPSYEKNGSIRAVFASEMNLEVLQKMFAANMPSLHSRFAVILSTGTILTVTGSDDPIDFYKGDIVSKTLMELRDPIWVEITAKIGQNYNQNISTTITIGGEEFNYIITIHNFTASPGNEWRFVSAICANDIFDLKMPDPRGSYIASAIPLVAGWAFSLIFKWVFDYLIGLEQNRLLTAKRGKQSKHLKKTGILLALSSLKRLLRSHADNPDVIIRIRDVVVELQSDQDCVYFSPHRFYQNIQNPDVRQKFIKLYGADDIPAEGIEIPHFWTCHHNKSSFHDSSTSMSIGFNLSFVETQAFIRRKGTLNLSREQSVEMIKAILHKYNASQLVFNDEDFDAIISELLGRIDDSLIAICADALEFNLILLQWKVQQMLYSGDFAFSLMISSLIWQIAMRKRNKPTNQLINRFFITERDKIIEVAKMVLISLFQACEDRDEDSLERWKHIAEYVMEIIEVSPLKFHAWVITRITLFAGSFGSIKQRNIKESTDLCRLLFIASTSSYAYHDPEATRDIRARIGQDLVSNDQKNILFMNCWNNEYFKPLTKCIGSMCEHRFIKKFFE